MPKPKPEVVIPETIPKPKPKAITPETEPEPKPEHEAVPDTEYCDAVAADARIAEIVEIAEDISCAAGPEAVAETAPAASIGDQVQVNRHDGTPTERVIRIRSTGATGADGKERKGFVFITYFRCGRVEVT